jgi:polysaccharide export outer membrane protein
MGGCRLFAALGTALLAISTGCTSSSGLLFRPGPHKLLDSAYRLSGAAARAPAVPRELEKQVLADYRVAPGDVLLIEPADSRSELRLPGDQTVEADGRISLGRFGRLGVAGKTVDQIETEVAEIVGREAKKQEAIVVRLIDAESRVYYVLGEVSSPGSHPLKGHETVLDAIVAAGGLSDRANQHKILLSRPTGPNQCRVVLPICYRRIVQLADATTNYQILPGDRIFVPSLSFWAELGQMCAPGGDGRCEQCGRPEVPCCDTVTEPDLRQLDDMAGGMR